jgi:hypothetical protein
MRRETKIINMYHRVKQAYIRLFINIAIKSFDNFIEFKYLGTGVRNQNCIYDQSKIILNSGNNRSSRGVLAWLSLRSWRRKQYVPPQNPWTSTRLHAVTSQKIELSIVTAAGTSNFTIMDEASFSGPISWFLQLNKPIQAIPVTGRGGP